MMSRMESMAKTYARTSLNGCNLSQGANRNCLPNMVRSMAPVHEVDNGISPPTQSEALVKAKLPNGLVVNPSISPFAELVLSVIPVCISLP